LYPTIYRDRARTRDHKDSKNEEVERCSERLFAQLDTDEECGRHAESRYAAKQSRHETCGDKQSDDCFVEHRAKS
jgi:hypothetical protein